MQRQDLETKYLDATRDLIKISGNEHGLSLTKYVKNQMKQEQ